MALQSSLTEVEWSNCFHGALDIGVTVDVCGVWWETEGGEQEIVCVCYCIHVIACIGVHGCMFVCMCVKCICIVCSHHL